ncbi:MAG: TROVE domain-containing protein [Candidatus Thiodiazotropha sp.]
MANKMLFSSAAQRALKTNTVNEAGGAAYRLSDKHALAQYAVTGCLNGTYYAGAETQLEQVLKLSHRVEPEFIARTAIWCRQHGGMKDMPALLCAILAAQGSDWLPAAFDQVIDNGRMLRNFVQILRSGVLGRKSLGSRPKRLVQAWLNRASEQQLLAAAVGNAPSLADVVKMVHPKPAEGWRSAFFAWLIGKPYDTASLPAAVHSFERYKREGGKLPKVPFQMLTSLPLTESHWATLAQRGGWQMVRMNLNSFQRHGVFKQPKMIKKLARRLTDEQAISKARAFPYQLLTAYQSAAGVPDKIRQALEQAMEIALTNVPELPGQVVVCPDVSGSMHCPATGWRQGATSVTRCIDVAALVAAAFLRKDRRTLVLPFDWDVSRVRLNAASTVMENATRLASIGGGGTNCSAPLQWLNKRQQRADLVLLVSDNESWVDSGRRGSSAVMQEWARFRKRNPAARLVCLDIQPYATTQAPEREDVLNIGGFSDAVFTLIDQFARGKMQAGHWVSVIESQQLTTA